MYGTKSVSLKSNRTCPSGYHKRRSYTSKLGHRVHSRCIRSTSPYKQSSAEFKRAVTQRQKRKLSSFLGAQKVCSAGKILRAPYVRKFGSAVRVKGYTRKTKFGKVVHIFPKVAKSVIVPATCIQDRGKKGKGTQKIGPLRKGELKRFGYSTRFSHKQRHDALRKAISSLGANNVYHKLDAVAKLSVRIAPKRSKIFTIDREWVRNQYGIKPF